MYAVITGASSGIGKEIAYILAEKGYHLILVARRVERLEKIRDELTDSYPIKVIPMRYDLSVPENCYKLHKDCMKFNVTILINSAGFGRVGFFQKIPLADEIAMIQTNLISLHILTKLFAGSMKKGRILNVSSMAGFQPGPMLSTYSATKSYVSDFSLALNYELKRHNKKVHISTLCPGPVDTEFNKVAGTKFSLKSISAKKCAEIAVAGMLKNKDLIIPSLTMKIMFLGTKLSPYRLILPIEYYIQTKKL